MKDFSELSADQVNDIVNRYYNGESATNLIEEYELNARPNNLYKFFPPEVLDELCEYCHVNLLKERESKSSHHYHWMNSDSVYCPKCSHKPLTSFCSCNNCLEKARIKRENMKEAIKQAYSTEYAPIDISTLSFDLRVFLGALVRTAVKEDLYNVIPYEDSTKILAPTTELNAEIYRSLSRNRIILVDPSSPLECFDIKSKDFPNVYYMFKVKYTLNLLYPTNKNDLFLSIISPQFYSKSMADDALKMWRKIAVQECIEYLIYQLDAVRFEFSPGEKTEAIFNTLLDNFSVSQIYAIIWSCVAYASRDYQERRMSRSQAANSVVSRCQKYGEKAKLSSWELKRFARLRDLPQSELSQYFFNQVVKIGDAGFDHKPNLTDLGGSNEDETDEFPWDKELDSLLDAGFFFDDDTPIDEETDE